MTKAYVVINPKQPNRLTSTTLFNQDEFNYMLDTKEPVIIAKLEIVGTGCNGKLTKKGNKIAERLINYAVQCDECVTDIPVQQTKDYEDDFRDCLHELLSDSHL